MHNKISGLELEKVIVTSPGFDYLWEELSNELSIKKANVKMERFPDTWPNIQIVKEDVKNKVATVLLDFSDPRDLFINYALLQWLIDYKVAALNIIMPYFPVGTMERVWKPGEVATAHSFANILSNLPSWKSWVKNNLHIFDIHAEVEEFLFDSKNINVENHSVFELLKEKIDGKTIVLPDEWADKRFWNIFKDFDKIVCSKKRIWWNRIIEVVEWDPVWKDLIIIDDLIQTWKTIIEASSKLKSLWAKSVSAFATHWVFPNNSQEKLAEWVDKLIVSDSIPKNNNLAFDIKNMEILKIKKLVKEIIID